MIWKSTFWKSTTKRSTLGTLSLEMLRGCAYVTKINAKKCTSKYKWIFDLISAPCVVKVGGLRLSRRPSGKDRAKPCHIIKFSRTAETLLRECVNIDGRSTFSYHYDDYISYYRIQSYYFRIYSYNASVVWRCSRLERFNIGEKSFFILETRHAINSAVNFYNAGVVTRDRRIGSRIQSFHYELQRQCYNVTTLWLA
jgi:hypothetical protein